MDHNGAPEPTVFQKFGGSIYLKIPPGRLEHLEIEHMLKEDTDNKIEAKCMAEENEEGEKYLSGWNPNSESQKGGQN